MLRRAIIVALFVSTVLRAQSSLASPEDLFGFGARSTAMGGLGATFLDDYAALYGNPAALSRARQLSFTFGYQAAIYRLWTASPIGADAQPLSESIARGIMLGITLPLPLGGILRDRIAIGLGIYTPPDVLVSASILRPVQPQFLVLGDRTQSVALQLGLGVALPWGFRVGASLATLANLDGSVVIGSGTTGMVETRVDTDLVETYAAIAGLSWEHGPVRLAAVYRDPLAAAFNVTVTAQNIGIPLPMLDLAGVAQYDPRQVALEAAFVHAGWIVAAGATFKRWSEYPGPVGQTTPISPVPPATNFHDTWVIRAGAEYRREFHGSEVAARLGYFFEQTPAPAVSIPGPSAYLDNDRHVATGGLLVGGKILDTRITVEVYGQSHFLVDRESVASGGTGPVTQSIAYGGMLFMLGTTATVAF